MSTECYKRGQLSLIAHPAGRLEGAFAFCPPQVWYNTRRQTATRAKQLDRAPSRATGGSGRDLRAGLACLPEHKGGL